VLLVPRIDPLRRIADGKVSPAGEARSFFKDRKALFFDRAGVNGRLVYDNVAALEDFANRVGCRQDRAEIGPAGAVYRSRHRDNVEIRFSEARRLVFKTQACLNEIIGSNLKRSIVSRTQLFHSITIDIETDDRHARPGKSDGDRQADIAKSDNGDFSGVDHLFVDRAGLISGKLNNGFLIPEKMQRLVNRLRPFVQFCPLLEGQNGPQMP